tara:strand:+ start:2057 stop:2641 length:585 start_codon:yes stop_codon:yes gene_type:complete
MKKILLLLLLIPIFSNSQSPYQAGNTSALRGGYIDSYISENIHRVHFIGRPGTSIFYADDMILLRSAEITLGNNYKYFNSIDNNTIITERLKKGGLINIGVLGVRTIVLSNEKDRYSFNAESIRISFCEKYSDKIKTNLCKSPPIYNVEGIYDGEEYVLDDYGNYQVWQLDENGNRFILTRTVKNVGDGKKPKE